MPSSARLFGRQRSVHQMLGGGIIADVILWRRRHATDWILYGTIAAFVVFEIFGYALLSLVSGVLLLLVSVLFTWAKAAGILNRPSPPIPNLHLSEELISGAAHFVHSQVNLILSISHDIALGKDPNLFYKVAACLLLLSVVGSWTDFITLGYTGLLLVLTIPVLYEKYEDDIDGSLIMAHVNVQQVYEKMDAHYLTRVKRWIMEKKKVTFQCLQGM